MSFEITYHEEVVSRDVPSLTPAVRIRIKQAIEEKLSTQPEVFGKPLRRSLKGYRRLRVGDYRVVFRISDQTVLIFLIAHRSVVYQKNRRL